MERAFPDVALTRSLGEPQPPTGNLLAVPVMGPIADQGTWGLPVGLEHQGIYMHIER